MNSDTDFKRAVDQSVARSSLRVFKIIWDDQNVWIKRPVPPKSKIWHRLLHAIGYLIPSPMLKPTVSTGGYQSLIQECTRIEKFRHAGFHVPVVMAQSPPDWVALSHMGDTAENIIKKSPESSQKIIEDCCRELARVHIKNLTHGRAKLNDFVISKNEKIGFIDFEESIESAKIPLACLQARELWLLMTSISKLGRDKSETLIPLALDAYKSVNTHEPIHVEFQKLINILKPLTWALNPFRKYLKKDALHAYIATQIIVDYLRRPVP